MTADRVDAAAEWPPGPLVLDAIFEANPHPFAVVSPNLRRAHANTLMRALAGAPAGLPPGDAPIGACVPGLVEPIRAVVRQALADRQPVRRPMPGSSEDVLAAFPLRDRAGGLAGVVVAVWPERVHLQHELRQARRDLEAERERLRWVLEQMPDGLIVADPSGRIVLLNQQARRMLNSDDASREAVERRRGSATRADGGRYRPEEYPMARTLAGEEVRGEEMAYAPPGEPRRVFEVSGSPIRGEHGRVIAGAMVMRDVTEDRRLRGELERLAQELEARVIERTAELEAAVAELETFSYTVSHDLRGPLRAVHAAAEILEELGVDRAGPEAARFLGLIRTSVERMDELITDLLNLARVGREPLDLQAVDMTALARMVVDDLRAQAGDRRLEVRVDPMPAALGDPGLVRQLLTNLVANAITFTAGRDPGRIRVGARGRRRHRVLRRGRRHRLRPGGRGARLRALPAPGPGAGLPGHRHRPGHRGARGPQARRPGMGRGHAGRGGDVLVHAGRRRWLSSRRSWWWRTMRWTRR